MSTTIPTTQSAASAAAMLTGNKVQRVEGGGNYLRFDSKRTGEWVIGKDNEGCTGDLFYLNVASLKHGYVLWHERKADRRMVPINAELPPPQDPIYWEDRDGREQVSEASNARAFEGAFASDGLKFSFEATSIGGCAAVDDLLAQLFLRANAGSPYLFPLVELGNDSYQHAAYGLIYVPVFTPVAWFDEKGEPEPEAAEQLDGPSDPEADPEPEARARPPQEPEPAVAQTEPAPEPTHRRRRADPAANQEEAPRAEEEPAPQPTRRRQRPAAA